MVLSRPRTMVVRCHCRETTHIDIQVSKIRSEDLAPVAAMRCDDPGEHACVAARFDGTDLDCPMLADHILVTMVQLRRAGRWC